MLTLKCVANSSADLLMGGMKSNSLSATLPLLRIDTRSSRVSLARYSCDMANDTTNTPTQGQMLKAQLWHGDTVDDG